MAAISSLFISRLFVYFLLVSFGLDPLPFYEGLRTKHFTPEARIESGFGFSKEVYEFFTVDYSNLQDIERQVRFLKEAGVSAVQVYAMRWSEVGQNPDGSVYPFEIHNRVNDAVIEKLTEMGIEIHSEFFTHFHGSFESRFKNPDSAFGINVPANQVPPLSDVVKLGMKTQFQDYVTAVVKRYPQIRFWGFINEADGKIYGFTAEELITLQNAFYDAVKRGNTNALVGSASPTLPEVIASPEKLHPRILEALGYYWENGEIKRDEGKSLELLPQYWKPYPEIYKFWKEFYAKAKYDVVQLHQLGPPMWNKNGAWKDDGFRKSRKDGGLVFDPDNSTRWQILKAGVQNVRELVGNKPITSQVGIGTDLDILVGSPEHWFRVQKNLEEATSGKYGYDFFDTYHLRENFAVLPDGKEVSLIDVFIFDEHAYPTPLYDTLKVVYQDYQQRLKKEFVKFFFD